MSKDSDVIWGLLNLSDQSQPSIKGKGSQNKSCVLLPKICCFIGTGGRISSNLILRRNRRVGWDSNVGCCVLFVTLQGCKEACPSLISLTFRWLL